MRVNVNEVYMSQVTIFVAVAAPLRFLAPLLRNPGNGPAYHVLDRYSLKMFSSVIFMYALYNCTLLLRPTHSLGISRTPRYLWYSYIGLLFLSFLMV